MNPVLSGGGRPFLQDVLFDFAATWPWLKRVQNKARIQRLCLRYELVRLQRLWTIIVPSDIE